MYNLILTNFSDTEISRFANFREVYLDALKSHAELFAARYEEKQALTPDELRVNLTGNGINRFILLYQNETPTSQPIGFCFVHPSGGISAEFIAVDGAKGRTLLDIIHAAALQVLLNNINITKIENGHAGDPVAAQRLTDLGYKKVREISKLDLGGGILREYNPPLGVVSMEREGALKIIAQYPLIAGILDGPVTFELNDSVMQQVTTSAFPPPVVNGKIPAA